MSKALPISALLEALAEPLSTADIIATTQKTSVSGQIVRWRTERRMSQTGLARLCGVKQSAVSKWENGDYNFTIEKMAQIAAALDMNLSVSLTPNAASEPAGELISEAADNIVRFPANVGMSVSASTALAADPRDVCSIESSEMLEEG
ncbi:MAG: helix-turn-helix domain-containing protein [Clostridiales bacterium]|nr:helix-turn-helix domain-containing protein [Clostridiales bacterium]